MSDKRRCNSEETPVNLLHNLTGYHRALAHALFRAFPKWKPHARMVQGKQELEVEFEIPDPVPGRNLPLQIRSWGGEALVSFAGWHTHIFFYKESYEEHAQKVVKWLQTFLEERIVVYAQTGADGRYTGGGHFSLPMSEQAQGFVNKMQPLEFRSWYGTYDGPNPPQEAA